MIEQLKRYDVYARNLFETIIYLKELYEEDDKHRGIYQDIINHLKKDIPILVTNEEVRKAFCEEVFGKEE